jgi:uncharacterized protein
MLEVERKLRAQLGEDLRAAMKGRDGTRAAAVRSLIAALDNASAVPLDDPQAAPLGAAPLAAPGTPAAHRSREVPRKTLSEDDVLEVLAMELTERRSAALSLEKHGCYEEATLVRAELEIIEVYVAWACCASAATGSA